MEITQQDITFCEKWSETRLHKLKFILIKGILNFALPLSLILTFFELIDRRFRFDKDIIRVFITLLLIAIVIGIIAAIITFKMNDKKYATLKNKITELNSAV